MKVYDEPISDNYFALFNKAGTVSDSNIIPVPDFKPNADLCTFTERHDFGCILRRGGTKGGRFGCFCLADSLLRSNGRREKLNIDIIAANIAEFAVRNAANPTVNGIDNVNMRARVELAQTCE